MEDQEDQKKVWNNIAQEWHEFKTEPSKNTLDFLKNKKGEILDLGSGSGRHLIKLKNTKFHLVDFSQNMIKLAKQKARRLKLKKQDAEFFVVDFSKENLPFEDNFFNAGICIHSLYCIKDPGEREKVLKELYRVLKPESETLISVWNKNSKRFKKSGKEKYISWKDKGKRYYYLFNEKEFRYLLEKTGFEIKEKIASNVNITFIIKKKSEDKIVEDLIKILKKTVEKQAPKSKFGLLLSGGIDSGLMALILKKLGYNFTCYTAEFYNSNFKKADDIKYAKFLAKKEKLKLKIIKVGIKDVEKNLPKVIKIIKSNKTTMVGIALPIYFCLKKANSDKIKTVLYDCANDCIFAGYHKHKTSKNLNQACIDSLKKTYKIDFPRDKAIANYFNVKLESPFLDKNLVSFSLKIPKQYKIQKGVEKYILRKASIKLGLPSPIAFRKKKAIQYSSNCQKLLKKLSKKNGFNKIQDYLDSIKT